MTNNFNRISKLEQLTVTLNGQHPSLEQPKLSETLDEAEERYEQQEARYELKVQLKKERSNKRKELWWRVL